MTFTDPEDSLVRTLFVSLSLSSIFLLNGCAIQINGASAQWPTLPPKDVNVRASLKQWLREHPEPKVVLRVPFVTTNVTQAQTSAPAAPGDGADLNRAYDQIEKALFKSGFTVRDRALLSNLLKDEKINSYKEIKSRVDTDLIIEISAISFNDEADMLKTLDYIRPDGKPGRANTPMQQAVARMDAKVVIVESGEVGAILNLRAPVCAAPSACPFNISGNGSTIYAPANGVDFGAGAGYVWKKGADDAINMDRGTNALASELIAALRE